jgi:hydrogenase maturation protease
MRVLVVGYGNTLCGDDGIGVYAAEQLQARLADQPTIEFYTTRQLLPELMETLSRVDAVIFIDAAIGETPGQIDCLTLLLTPQNAGAFSHQASASALLDATAFCYGRRPAAWLYTVCGENFELGDPFSPAVRASLPDLLDTLTKRIESCTNME